MQTVAEVGMGSTSGYWSSFRLEGNLEEADFNGSLQSIWRLQLVKGVNGFPLTIN